MAQMINKKYFTSDVIGWDKNTEEDFDIIIKPDSGKQISTVMTMYIPNNFVGGFEGFSGNIIFDKNFIFERKGHDGNMLYMFRDATKFNQDLSHWDLSKSVMLDGFFEGAREFDNNGKQFVLDLRKYTENDLYIDYKFQDMFKGTKLKDLKVINNADKNMDGSVIFNGMNSIENLEFNGLKNVSIDWLSDKYGIIDVDGKKEIENVGSYKFEDGKSYKVYLKNSKYDEKASEEAKKKAEEEKKKKEEAEAKKKAEEEAKKKAEDEKNGKSDSNKAEFNIKFDDVKEGKYYTEAVYYVAKNGIMKGTGDNKFSPKKPIRKGQLVTMLFRLSKDPDPSIKNTSTDVKSGKYYEKPLLWASTKDICKMDNKNRFYPNEELDRESFVVIMYNYAKYEDYGLDNKADLSKYSDLSQVKNKEAMEWAVGNGIIKGTGADVLSPNKKTNRAQMATVFMRFMQKFVDKK